MAVDKLVDSAQLDGDLTSVANAIRSKGGTSAQLSFPSGMVSAIDAIPTKQAVSWNQCPQAVKNFISNVTYDTDYTYSHVQEYAPTPAVKSNTKPIGKTVDGVTYYNEVPNVETPFSADSAAGTLKPLDALRWLNTVTPNVRDIGGWACDGGTVKYGLLIRGGYLRADDRNVLVGQLGIQHDLDLRGATEAPVLTESPLGSDVYYTCAPQYAMYALTPVNAWKINLRTIFDAVTHNEPVYFHCSAGADRTGTLACVLEGILGVSQSDIDKDYELTSFYTLRARNGSYQGGGPTWAGLISQINALSGSTFRDKCVNFVASLGFTAAEINAFRAAMIDGTPGAVTPSIDTYTVTNTLTNATSDNSAASAVEYQPYTAKITPASGYAISSVQIKMGGVDVTGAVWSGTETVLRRKVTVNLTHCTSNNRRASVIDGQGYAATLTAADGYTLDGATVTITMGGVDVSTFYKDGVIAIPNVTGDLEITVTAVQSAVEIINLADVYGVTSGVRISVSSGENSNLANTVAVGANRNDQGIIPWIPGDVFRFKGVTFSASSSTQFGIVFYNADASYPSSAGISPWVGLDNSDIKVEFDESSGIGTITLKTTIESKFSARPYLRFSLPCTDASQLIITKNQEIT